MQLFKGKIIEIMPIKTMKILMPDYCQGKKASSCEPLMAHNRQKKPRFSEQLRTLPTQYNTSPSIGQMLVYIFPNHFTVRE